MPLLVKSRRLPTFDYWTSLGAELVACLILPPGAPSGLGTAVLHTLALSLRERLAGFIAAPAPRLSTL